MYVAKSHSPSKRLEPVAKDPGASSVVLAVHRAAWRSSTCATWFSTRVRMAMAIKEATQASMPTWRLNQSLMVFMPPL